MEIKALVANSSKKELKNIAKSLKEIGVQKIVEATDSKQTMEALQKGKFDVIFTEANPQCCEGEEFWKTARKNDSKLPIFVTAQPSKKMDELKKAYPNATSYVTMPLTKEQLKTTVSQYFPTLAG